jgi:hypothetical protein
VSVPGETCTVVSNDSTVEAAVSGIDATAHGAGISGDATANASVNEKDEIVAEASGAGTLLLPPVSSVRLRANLGELSASARLSSTDLSQVRFEVLRARAENASLHEVHRLVRNVKPLAKLILSRGPATATASAQVTPTGIWVVLHEARLGDAFAQAGASKLNGAWRGAGEARVGPLRFGARFERGRVQQELFPRDRWLQRQLEDLGFGPSRPGS